ncbi:methyl-accepting chemotaxis protein [Bacillus shivajii]|nr:methyl-accepting chemotaxis protein [Bacillus shivajii]UCZ52166.1 methyl-accepting chemotaxis protein [Bacillus shivajii]
MFKKINTKMIVSFTVLIILILGSVSAVTVFISQDSIEENALVQANSSVHEMERLTEMYLDQFSISVDRYSDSDLVIDYLIEAEDFSTESLQRDFEKYLDSFENITLAYIASAETTDMFTVPNINLPADFDPTTRPWYEQAAANPDEVIFTEPYIDESNGEYVLTVAKAVQDPRTNRTLGVVASDLTLDTLAEIISHVQVGYDGYSFLFDQNGTAMVHPTESGNDLSELDFIQSMYASENDEGSFHYTHNGDDRFLAYGTIEHTDWKVGTVYLEERLMQESNQLLLVILIVSIIGIVLAIIITFFISQSITKPIITLKEQVNKVAEGDLTVRVNSKSKDEIGVLSNHFNRMVENMKELISSVEGSVSEVSQASQSLSALSEETTASSEEVGRAISEIASGANQQASDIESANQKSMSLSSKIDSVSEQNEQMNVLSNGANESSQQGSSQIATLKDKTNESNEVIQSVNDVLSSLVYKIKEIESVIGTINEISEQTNLLALNASIEAARAGEHGRGFAVVADEVRKLAEQSSDATEQVRKTILGIQGETKNATEAMDKTNKISEEQLQVVDDTENVFKSIDHDMKKIIQSIEAISQDIEGVNQSKDDVIGTFQSISAVSEESAASTEEITASIEEQIKAISTISHSAEELNESSEKLKKMIEVFNIR